MPSPRSSHRCTAWAISFEAKSQPDAGIFPPARTFCAPSPSHSTASRCLSWAKTPTQPPVIRLILPEIPPLYVDMTVYEYLKFVAELKKLDRKKRKEMIADAMDMTGITEVKNRLIKNLSKGYRQRVGFAQALLGYPEIIILDEPTVGLDPKQIIEIRELIKKLGENHTVILSSHILSEISAVCDHVFIISKGKLVASDATENLINLMSKNQEINLVLKSDEIGARGMLEKIVNVDKVTFEKSEEEKTVKAKVIAKANCDIREEIFELASAMHMPILEMHTVVKSLEDVFLELTGEGDEK